MERDEEAHAAFIEMLAWAATMPKDVRERRMREHFDGCRRTLAAGPSEDDPLSWIGTADAFLQLFGDCFQNERPQG